MTSIIFESSAGIVFEKTTYKNGRCKLAVKNKSDGASHIIYRYKDVDGVRSPYISWDNWNCCGAWKYDESYLYTAVQRGKKLFAGVSFYIYFDEVIQEQMKLFGRKMPGETDVADIIQKLQSELPGDCLLLKRDFDRMGFNGRNRYIDICKKGAIADYIDLDEVFAAYERFGVTIDSGIKTEIIGYCSESIEELTAHFDYAHIIHAHRFVVAGLLLGYPIESTAALLEKKGILHIDE